MRARNRATARGRVPASARLIDARAPAPGNARARALVIPSRSNRLASVSIGNSPDPKQRADPRELTAKMLERLQQRESLEATVRLAGSVAHDMNNVLGAVMGIAELLKQDLPEDHPWNDDLASILDVSDRGRKLVRELVERVREHKLQKNRVRLDKTVRQTTGLLKRVIPSNIELELELPEQLPEVNGDPLQLGQTIMDLCQNAVEAMREDGGTLSVMVAHVVDAASEDGIGVVRVTIRDTGVGMDETTRARAFDPYFTTKYTSAESFGRPARRRVRGLGLTTAFKTVNSHGGSITLESAQGVGTTVIVELPAISGPVTA